VAVASLTATASPIGLSGTLAQAEPSALIRVRGVNLDIQT
jgi:hypothetical protein